MIDRRWHDLAEILVDYSTQTSSGDQLAIMMMEIETFPLVRAVYQRAVQAGALPQVLFTSALLERDLMVHGNETQLEWVPHLEMEGMVWADTYIALRGARNPYESSGFPANVVNARKHANGKVSAARTTQTRWALVRVPNESLAQQAQMSLDEMMEFFFSAALRDWAAEGRRYERLSKIFGDADNVRIVGERTDITFSTSGRRYAVGDGRFNIPDGEIYTAPVESSVEGEIYFEFPGVWAGQRIEGIHLGFDHGKVVEAVATANEPLLQAVLETDEGSRIAGEFGVGTNYGITKFIGDILYDEKIGGTVHLALGRAYEECGGVNKSAVHWDLIKDLRNEGAIFLDARKVYDNGQWLIEW
jgi:aminopeptidase